MVHVSESNLVIKPTKKERYQYAIVAILIIIVTASMLLSFVAVSLPVVDALNKVSINNVQYQEVTIATPPLVSFSTGNYTLNYGQGYLNITNTGDKDITLNLKMSATITGINTEHTDYPLGSTTIPNVTVKANSSTIVSATVKDTTPIVNWTQRPSGSFTISWSVQASVKVNYLWHITLQKSFEHIDSMNIF
jgi:hypothetical protein